MKKVEFSVGAKAARLIGRENIADVDGALMELIKNAYDADASCVMVRYHIPFLDVPSKVDIGEIKKILSEDDFRCFFSYYDEDINGILIKKNLSDKENTELEEILSAYNSIIIADNGCGMSYETVTSSWMYIGTSDKEKNYTSAKGRIKTGAKGIGRFALDKLSKCSRMYTKTSSSDKMIAWAMDWDQFAKARLISEVEADIDEIEDDYKEIISRHFDSDLMGEYDWSHGTLIVLSPTRELWSKRLFKKVNTNLRSINPIGSVDRFDVIITNDFYSDYNYKTEQVAIDKEDYDYRIRVNYDGEEKVLLQLQRNEVDLSVKRIVVEKYNESIEKSTEEFWNRKAFLLEHYHREDYDSELAFEYGINELLPNDSLDKVKKVGPFSAELYFMRRDNNERYPLMKSVSRSKRSAIVDKFSGIKIYRDAFKVRPYGDEGSLYDWLELGTRSQKSPAGVAHPTGSWKVEPYQIIGWVLIGRENNPLLEDMANREGLALNEHYYIFRDLMIKAIAEFEFDRQYVYRECGKWIKEIENEIASRHKSDKIIEAAKRQMGGKKEANSGAGQLDSLEDDKSIDVNAFTEEEYLGAVQQLVEDSERKLNEKQIMQILSSSGIVLNTFFHEFNAINTQFHVEAPQIRSRIRYILNNQEYTGLQAYDPYQRIDALEKNDRVTAAFLDVVMEGLKKDNLNIKEIHLKDEIEQIIEQWELMLKEKHISLDFTSDVEEEVGDKWKLAKVDLYIILNNFMLNSAWFLEETHNANRCVTCSLLVREKTFELVMKNNGPSLNSKYQYNPNKIFELGETTKEKKTQDDRTIEGTGLGLWILKETVERNNGIVEVLTEGDGFALRITVNR